MMKGGDDGKWKEKAQEGKEETHEAEEVTCGSATDFADQRL